MINMLIEETVKDRSRKTYIFYGFNVAASIVGFLLAGLASGIAWSVRETLPSRRTTCERGQVCAVLMIPVKIYLLPA